MERRLRVFALAAALVLPTIDATAQTTRHRRPFTGDYGVTAHYDADGVKGNGVEEDYTCAADSYDGHSGTDYGLPLGSEVVASAPGTVNRTNDGCNDYGGLGNTCGGYLGNWVEVVHADGSYSMYAHMKRGSLQVSPGDAVECGTVLGQSASSGSSTGPHLHYGSRKDSSGSWSHSSTRDPYEGPCGRNETLWTNQGQYQGAPGTECQNQEVDVDVWIESAGVEDLLTQGSSLEKADALAGETFEVSIYVRNNHFGPIREVELGYVIEEPFLRATDYVIESDVSGGGEFGVNDADADEANPPKDAMGPEGALTMYAFASGETKRVRITLEAAEPNIGKPDQDHPDVRGWIRNIADVYTQEGFADDPTQNDADERLVAFQEFDVLTQAHWDFDADEPEMLEGWTPCGDGDTEAAIAPERGGAVVTASGVPCLLSPAWTSIDAANDKLVIDVESDAGPHTATLWWTRSGDEDFAPERAIEFEIPASPTVVEVPLNEWTGVIDRLRLEPTADQALGAEVLIGSIRFVPADEVVDPGGDGDGETEDDPNTDASSAGEGSDGEDLTVIEGDGGCQSAPVPRGGSAPCTVLLFGLLLLGRRAGRSGSRSSPD
jgi:murein DD-endopeptidase MepM/ murein hydrolase activator NlpD